MAAMSAAVTARELLTSPTSKPSETCGLMLPLAPLTPLTATVTRWLPAIAASVTTTVLPATAVSAAAISAPPASRTLALPAAVTGWLNVITSWCPAAAPRGSTVTAPSTGWPMSMSMAWLPAAPCDFRETADSSAIGGCGVTLTDADAALVPIKLIARTTQVWEAPLVSPVTAMGEVLPLALMLPGLQVTA